LSQRDAVLSFEIGHPSVDPMFSAIDQPTFRFLPSKPAAYSGTAVRTGIAHASPGAFAAVEL